MKIEEIVVKLTSEESTFPKKALKEAIKNREEIIPHLLKILEETNNRTELLLEQSGELYAMFLLAQFREPLAYPLIVQMVSKDPEVVEDLLGDIVTEDLGRILASVCGGELKLIKKLIENPEIYEYVRSSALKALIILVAHRLLSRDEVINYFRELIQSKLSEEDKSYVWTALVVESTYLCPQEIEPEIKELFEKDLIDPFMIRIEHFQAYAKESVNQSLAKLRKNPHYTLVNNVITDLKGWLYVEENKPEPIRITEEVAPTFSDLVAQVSPSNETKKKSKKKKKGFG